ncbi:MAG: YgeY family selenium metabolism-linked hydrolase [Chloroflexi bacterium]|nr:YgeY family selenium metabolism-linked hydrolase [Chloroflexota bacterium]
MQPRENFACVNWGSVDVAGLIQGKIQGLIPFTQQLVRIPSLFGQEGEVAQAVFQHMQLLGFDQVWTDTLGNVIGIWQGQQPGKTVLFDAHMDTIGVAPRNSWQDDPFSGKIKADRMYGRGTSDMKGSLAAAIYGAASLDRAKLAGKIVISASVCEEIIEGIALKQVMEQVHPDFVIIGEPSDLTLVRGGRGRAEFALTTKGAPAHASTPSRGINAIHKMMRVIREVEALSLSDDPVLGSGVLALTDIISDPYPAQSVVPSGCRVTYERRLVSQDTRESVLTAFQEACQRADAAGTQVDLVDCEFKTYTDQVLRQPKWFPAWTMPEDHPLVRAAQAGLQSVGITPRLTAFQFCTNAAYSAGEAQIPTIGFGPSHENRCHVIDEYILLEELQRAALGYAAIMGEILR